MNNKRRHFKMACLASVAVLLGACSSTPDVKSTDSGGLLTPSSKQPLTNKAVYASTIKQKNIATDVPKKIAVTRKVTPVATRKLLVMRNVAKRQVAASPRKTYVPPRPIVVAVHKRVEPVASQLRRPTASVRKVALAPKQYQLPEVRPRAKTTSVLRRPSSPIANAVAARGAPVIRPATVPRSNAHRSVYVAPKSAAQPVAYNQQRARAEQARLKQAREQQLRVQQAEQQRARVQWEKDKKALAYRVKWERDQQVKAQLQLAQQQQNQQQQLAQQRLAEQQRLAQQRLVQQQRQAQEQQANAYHIAWERDQRVKAQQQQAKKQQAQWQQEQARQQQARQQQARIQQASYKPRVNNAVLQRPINNYSQSRITGDFAGNPRAAAFVRMMASRHRFDPSYVAGVLSRAKATAWLRKQAYKDANPVKRTKKSRGPSWSNYRRRFITSKHINTGAAFYNSHRRSLQRAENQYGVPAEYILGILGVETIFGGNVGSDRAIDALATLGFMNARRGNYFTSELESYFVMTRRARLDPLQPKASWAGALGLPQFMPSNIKKYGVDYDGDGAVNLWTPQDAIGSVANYLRSHGWRPGEIAAIPAVKTGGRGYANLRNGFKHKHSLSKLARNGLRPAYAGVSGNVNMVKLRTNRGNEYWVGGNNFYVITRYNHSSHYAMAVHQLAQEIRKRVKPGGSRSMPRVIEASNDQSLLMQAASSLL